MSDETYLYLSDVEKRLTVSRDTLNRAERAGLLRMDGTTKGRRVVASTYYALKARIDAGEDLWQLIKASESPAPSEPSITEKAPSTRIVRGDGGISRRRKRESAKDESEQKTSKGPSWLKPIT